MFFNWEAEGEEGEEGEVEGLPLVKSIVSFSRTVFFLRRQINMMLLLVDRILKHFSEQAESARRLYGEVMESQRVSLSYGIAQLTLLIALSKSTAQRRTASLIQPWLPLVLGQHSWITTAPQLMLSVMLEACTHQFWMCWIMNESTATDHYTMYRKCSLCFLDNYVSHLSTMFRPLFI